MKAKIAGYTCPIADGEVRPGRSPGGQEGWLLEVAFSAAGQPSSV